MSSLVADESHTSFSVPLELFSFCKDGSEISSFIVSDSSALDVIIGASVSTPCLLFTLDTGSGRSWHGLILAGSLTFSPSDSEPEAELLSDGE